MSGRPQAPEAEANTAPETIEGWYVLHDAFHIRWDRWRGLEPAKRQELAEQLSGWASCQVASKDADQGGSAAYQVVSQKADLLFIHYRRTPEELADVQRSLQVSAINDVLEPAFGYLSVVEASLYEATGIAHGILARRGLSPGKEGFEEAFSEELERQKQALRQRVFRTIPQHSHVCYYPMSKRRGEHVNWYDMPMEERRAVMRGHGRIGHKYIKDLTQVISGSVGFDNWEWAVDLHSDDPLLFKKLIYEMRFDPATSRFAEFGEFVLGIRREPQALVDYLNV